MSKLSTLQITVLFAVALGAAGVGGHALWRHLSAPKPPVMALQGVDPAIVKLIRAQQDLVRQEPYSGGAWGALGKVLYAHAFVPQANACFEKAERYDSQEPRWPYLRALCFLQEDPNVSHALPDLKRAAVLTGDSPDAPRLRLAEVLLDAGQMKDAAALLQQAIQHDPGSARSLLDLGRLALLSGNLTAAREDLTKSYQVDTSIRATQVLLAQVIGRLGNAAVSTALAKQAAGVPEVNDWPDPYKAEALQMAVGRIAETQHGEQLVSTGQFAEAITQMQQTVAQYPDAARAWMLLGAAYTGSGDPAAGESALRKSLSLDPNSIECTNHLGNALAREGHISEAAACFTKALAGSPRSAEYHFNLGVCLYLQHKTAAAIQEFEAAVQIEPNAVKNHASLGDALAQGHQTAAAIQQYQIGLKLHPRDRILERSLARLQNAPAH